MGLAYAHTFAQATKLSITQGPATAIVGRVFSTAIVVEVRDANDNLVTDTPVSVRLEVVTGVLSGTITGTTVNGQMVFTDFGNSLRVNVAGANTLIAKSGLLQNGTWDFAVGPAGTQTSSSSTPNSSSAFGESITFRATVVPQSPGEGSPTGTVQFKNGSTVLGAGTLDGSGQSVFTTSTLPVGPYDIVAEYSGDGNFLASSSTAFPYTVQKGPVMISFAPAFGTTLGYNQGVTFTATISAALAGAGIPSGVVAVRDVDSTLLATIPLNASGSGTNQVFLAPRSAPYTPTAYYSGDANFASSSVGGAVLQVTIGGATIGVVASASSVPYGTPVTLTASITGPNGAAVPTGTVTFFDRGVEIGSAVLDNSGTATLNPLLEGGDHQITVQYNGDGNYQLGTSDLGTPTTLRVVTTTTSLTSSANPSTYGEAITLTAAVTSNVSGPVTGEVQFAVDGVPFGSGVPLSGAVAVLAIPGLAAGLHEITASYSGDAIFGSSTSLPLVQVINPKQLTVTGLSAQNKPYDGTTSAALSGNAVLNGAVEGDDVTLSGTAEGTFSGRNVGNGVRVSVTGVGISGAESGNYTLAPLNLYANITKKALVVSGVTAPAKNYDGNTTAMLIGGLLSGVVGTEDVTFSLGLGTFASANVGTWTITVDVYELGGADSGNYSLSQPVVPDSSINPAQVNIVSGIAANSKVYDRTTAATISSNNVVLSGIIAADVNSVQLSTNGFSAEFSTAQVGEAKPVSVAGLSLIGTAASNYQLKQPSGLTANITPKALTITDVTAVNKAYDGTASAALSPGTLQGVVAGDVVTIVAGSGNFDNANVGTWTVTAAEFRISGVDSPNYTLSGQPSVPNGSITPAAVTILSGIWANDKAYDRTTGATISSNNVVLSGVLPSDDGNVALSTNGYTASFSNPLAGNGKDVQVTGLALTGTASGNYFLPPVSGFTANITPKFLTLTGLLAANKTYDGTAAASVSGGTLNGVIDPDVVTVIFGTATFANASVGTWSVTADGFGIGGIDSGNYMLAGQPLIPDASITFGVVTISSGIAGDDKVYDGTIAATIRSNNVTLSGILAQDLPNVRLSTNGYSAAFANSIVQNGKMITVSGLSLTGAGALNYTLMQPALTANITPKHLTVAGVVAMDKVYDRTTVATLDTTAAVLIGIISGESLSVNAAGAVGAFTDANVGVSKPVSISGLAIAGATAANYTVTQPSTTANITPAALAISGVTANNKTYDGTTVASLAGTPTLTGVIAGDTVVLGGTPVAAFATRNVGTSIVVNVAGYNVSGISASNYRLTQPVLFADITPKSLTVTGLVAADKVYDQTLTATLSGSPILQGIISPDIVTLSGTGSGTFNTANVGNNKPVTVSNLALAGNDALNYALVQPSLTASITPKPLTVTGIIASDKIYDRNTSATLSSANATISGVISGDIVTITGATGTFADFNVGLGKQVNLTISVGGTSAANYSVSPASTTASITPKPITVDVSGMTANNKNYDGSTAATVTGTAGLSGVINGDGAKVSLVGSPVANFVSAAVGNNIAVNLTGLAITGPSAANYSLVQPATGLFANILPQALTITANNRSKLYGQALTFAGTEFTASGLVAGDSLTSVTLTSAGAAATAAATAYPITATGAVGTGLANYSITYQSGVLTVSKATVSVTNASVVTRVYDRTTAAVINGTLIGAVNGDALSLNGTGTFATANAGVNIAVTSTSTLGGPQAANYTLTQPVGLTGTILPRPLTVSNAAVTTKAYDGSITATITGALTGVISPDAVSIVGAATFDNPNAGTGKAVTAAATLTGAQAANYTLVQPVGLTGTITPKTLTVTGNSATKVYGQTLSFAGSEFTVTGLIAGETVGTAVITSLGAPATASVSGSPYTINVSGLTGGNFIPANYSITYLAGTLTITKATLTVTADNTTRTYGAPNPLFSATITGFVNGQTLATSGVTGAAALSSTATAASNVGSYPITAGAGTLNSADYSFSFVTGTLVVTKAVLIVIADDKSRTYGGTNPLLTVTYSGFQNGQTLATSGVTGSPGVSTSATATSPVGTYGINPSVGTLGAANYTFSFVNGNLTITPAALTITPKAVSVVYSATLLDNNVYSANIVNYIISGFQNGENATSAGLVLSGSMAFNGSVTTSVRNTGVYTQAKGSLTLSSSANNYVMNFSNPTPNNYVITPKPLVITANSTTKVQGATLTFAGTEFSQNGLLGADTISSVTLTSTGAGAAAAVGTYSIVPTGAVGSGVGNYTVTYVNGTLSVVAGPFVKLQILLPGETAAPGTPSGKTGSPNAQLSGAAFNVTVNAVDANWNLVSSVTDIASLSANDTATGVVLPVPAGLASGTRTFTVTLITATPAASLTASDVSDSAKTPAQSAPLRVNANTVASIATSANPSCASETVTFTASITSSPAAAGIPTGSVQFTQNGVNIGVPVALNSSGQASISRSFTTTGSYVIGATYVPSGVFLASATSPTVTQSVVGPAAPQLQVWSNQGTPSWQVGNIGGG